jgi:hypothetical protein
MNIKIKIIVLVFCYQFMAALCHLWCLCCWMSAWKHVNGRGATTWNMYIRYVLDNWQCDQHLMHQTLCFVCFVHHLSQSGHFMQRCTTCCYFVSWLAWLCGVCVCVCARATLMCLLLLLLLLLLYYYYCYLRLTYYNSNMYRNSRSSSRSVHQLYVKKTVDYLLMN